MDSQKLGTLVCLRKLSLWGPYKSAQLKSLLMAAKDLPCLQVLELHHLQASYPACLLVDGSEFSGSVCMNLNLW